MRHPGRRVVLIGNCRVLSGAFYQQIRSSVLMVLRATARASMLDVKEDNFVFEEVFKTSAWLSSAAKGSTWRTGTY